MSLRTTDATLQKKTMFRVIRQTEGRSTDLAHAKYTGSAWEPCGGCGIVLSSLHIHFSTYEELVLEVHVVKRLNNLLVVGLDDVLASSDLLCKTCNEAVLAPREH